MKEKPIIFSTPMVQAILEGKKTMTRRVIKPQPIAQIVPDDKPRKDEPMAFWVDNKNWKKPYVEAGDILWVREAFRVGAWRNNGFRLAFDYKASPEIKKTPWVYFAEETYQKYESDIFKYLLNNNLPNIWAPGESPLPWQPSIHMPREAARIFLKVTNVRVEQVQDITEEDAKAEGSYLDRCECLPRKNDKTPIEKLFRQTWCHIHGEEFKYLWDSLNAKRGFPWEDNPWVWAIEFRRIKE